MRPVIKNQIALFSPQGFIDGNNAPAFINGDDIHFTKGREPKATFISLAKVVYFNKNGIESFLKILENIRGESQMVIGFCDYKPNLFESIKKIYDEKMPFCMFDSKSVLELFVSSRIDSTDKNILLFAEEKTQKNSIAFELHKRGFKATIAKDRNDFNAKKVETDESGNKRFFETISMSYIGSFQDKIASNVHGNLVIYNLSGYVDNTINERFDLIFHQNSLNVGFKLFVFDCKDVLSLNIHGVNFFAKLSIAAAEFGATICLAGLEDSKIQERFRVELEDAGMLFFLSLEKLLNDKKTLEEYGGGAAVNKKGERNLTKELIAKLPIFINASIYTMNIITNIEPIKEPINLSELQIEGDTKELIASSIGFYGDVDGLIVLIFSRNVAHNACKIFLGEEIGIEEDIIDGLAEFVNIIAGRAKTTLAQQKCNIKLTLPRTFGAIKELFATVEGKKGALVQLRFGEDPFYFFLTR